VVGRGHVVADVWTGLLEGNVARDAARANATLPVIIPTGAGGAGAATDPRLDHAADWLLRQQDEQGRWANRYAYAGKMGRGHR
jgi:hypothetical protein